MPPSKRLLSEVDPNATRLPIISNSKYKLLQPGDRYGVFEAVDSSPKSSKRQRHDGCAQETASDGIDYHAKDNSRLRNFLEERDLSTAGTREEMITRLERNPIDYESLTAARLHEMLSGRHVANASQGTKEVKIQRLRVNDMIDRETGDSKDGELYGKLSVREMVVEDLEEQISTNYAGKKSQELVATMKRRNLSTAGDMADRVERLRNADLILLEEMKEARVAIRLELEERIGHSVDIEEMFKRENKAKAQDIQILTAAAPTRPPVPVCQYDWKKSHWATRTERELREIAGRREMPGGYGTKAAMIKWLETGHLDYGDLFVGSLEDICNERGLHFRSGAKKADLIKILEADEDRVEGQGNSKD